MWGWVVTIDHGNGMKASYCGLQKEPAVKKGGSVKMGDVIGKVGEIPVEMKDEPHLHFEVRVNGTVTDRWPPWAKRAEQLQKERISLEKRQGRFRRIGEALPFFCNIHKEPLRCRHKRRGKRQYYVE